MKVRLALDELRVQSFRTSPADARRGTVNAHDAPTDAVECPTVDPLFDSCWESCYCGSADCSNSCDCYTGGCGGAESFLATNCRSYGLRC